MENFFEHSDIDVIIKCLSVFPLFQTDVDDVQLQINSQLSNNVIEKFSNNITEFSANEIRVMYCAIECISAFLSGSFNEVNLNKQDWFPYMFTLNKLSQRFESVLPELTEF